MVYSFFPEKDIQDSNPDTKSCLELNDVQGTITGRYSSQVSSVCLRRLLI